MQFGHDVVVSALKEYLRGRSDGTHSEVEKQTSDAGDSEERQLNHQENA